MRDTTHTLTCRGCDYTAPFPNEDAASKAAFAHVDRQGEGHIVSCTRPAHFQRGAVPVFEFTCYPRKNNL